MSDPRFEAKTPYSDEEIRAIEKELGRELPPAYRHFVKQYGGAFVGGFVDGEWEVLDFFDASTVLEDLRGTFSDFRDIGALPFARDVGGNLWVLTEDNSVHFLVNYSGSSTAEKISDSFQDFLDRIVLEDDEEDDEDVEDNDNGDREAS
jgi:hypothetical protein